MLYGFLFTKQNNKLKRKILPVFLLSSNMNLLKLSFAVLLAVVVTSCDTRNTETTDRVVIGIAADVQTFNPLFSVSVDEGSITELLYLSLVDFRWDEDKSDLQSNPMLAKKWEWSPDSTSITFFLRDDVYWSDGKQCTADDIIFSFDVYSDPEVQSGWYGTFGTVYTDEENHVDIEKTFDVASQFEFTINFKSGTVPKLYDLVFPIISKHVYENIKRNELATSEINFNPVTNGPFKLKKWNRNQIVSLEANPESFLYNEDNIDELVFKVVQDYTSRILQLKHGDIDLMELVKIEDIEEIESEETLQIVPVVGREYDYAGWNNIDPTAFTEEGKIFPNKFFSSSKVRIALSHAINRQEILEEYFIGYGKIAVTPVSPIFSDLINNEIVPYEYDVAKARQLLKSEGWVDTNNDGTIEKGNEEFSFTMYIPAGNPLRNFASTIIKNNFKAVGIEMNVETLELGKFIDNLFEKKMDAWMAAWYIPIPLEIKTYWYSDLERTPLNFTSYQSKSADELMDELEVQKGKGKREELYKKFQHVIHDDEPVTFLYWVPNINVYNKKIDNINITPLGSITHCWEWKIKR